MKADDRVEGHHDLWRFVGLQAFGHNASYFLSLAAIPSASRPGEEFGRGLLSPGDPEHPDHDSGARWLCWRAKQLASDTKTRSARGLEFRPHRVAADRRPQLPHSGFYAP